MTTTDDILKRLGIKSVGMTTTGGYQETFSHSDLERIVAEMQAEIEGWKQSTRNWEAGYKKSLAAFERRLGACQAENKMLRDALKGVLPYVVTQVIACNGLKCRESVCESCSFEPEIAAQKSCDACHIAKQAISTPSDHSALDAAIRQAKIEALEEAAARFRGDIGYNWIAADNYENSFDIASELDFMANELKGE